MSSRNDPRRIPMRDPLEGVGLGDVPVIDPNRPKSDIKKEELLVGAEEALEVDWTPLGQMLAAKLVQSADGQTKAGGIIIPDGVNWVTTIFVVVAVGPEVKYVKVGDHVLVSPEVRPQVVRQMGPDGSLKSSLYLHEQQCFGYLNDVRSRIEKQVTPPTGDDYPSGPKELVP